MIHSLINRKKLTSGFTLIELLVVIAIIGVLASVVLASLNTARRKSRDARRIADIKQIQLALELFFDGVGISNYPLASGVCSAIEQNGLERLQTNNYMPQVPRDPQSTGVGSGCYTYGSPTGTPRTTYHLGAVLEETTNTALLGDRDAPVTTVPPWTNDFTGLSAGTTLSCNTTAGTQQTGGGTGTELCYDVIP